MKVVKPIVFRNYGFSRSSEATYYDSTGVLRTAEIDELRLGYNPTTLEFIGPIIEPETTNLLVRSSVFTNAAWVKSGSTVAANDAAAIAPDGSVGCNYFYTTGVSGLLTQNISGPLNELPYSYFSVYVKVKTPHVSPSVTNISLEVLTVGEMTTGVIVFNLFGDGYIVTSVPPWISARLEKLQDGWFRISVGRDLFISGVLTARIGLTTAHGGAEFYLFGAQVEQSMSPSASTSYIYTTTSIENRAADIQSPPPSLVLSNIAENDHPDWDSGVNYSAGNQVIVRGDYHRVYEALTSSTDIFPPDNPEYWLDQGATNRWRMFDMNVGAERQTVSNSSDNSVEVLVGLNQPVNSVVLLNLEGTFVTVIMRDSDGNEVYRRELSLSLPSAPDWWSFFFAVRRNTKTIVLTDLPPYRPSTIEMILEGGDEPAKIGKMIVGDGVDIGCARYGTGVGIVDFSRKERDPFGNNFVLERRYIDRAEFDIQLLTNRVDEVKDLLAEVRATPVVYVGEENFKSTVIFGFYRDFSIILSGHKRSDCTLEVEGI